MKHPITLMCIFNVILTEKTIIKAGIKRLKIFLALSLSLFLIACGGGGSGGNSDSDSQQTKIQGSVFLNTFLANTDVIVRDASGKTQTIKTDASGNFSASLTDMQPPFLLQVSVENEKAMYGIIINNEKVNITPLSDYIVRNWYLTQSSNIDEKFADDAAISIPSKDNIALSQLYLQKLLATAAIRFSLDENFDLLTSELKKDNAYDELLSHLTISRNEDNISITLLDPDSEIESLLIEDLKFEKVIDQTDNTPPDSVSNVASSQVSQSGLSLSWDMVVDESGIAGYRVFRDSVLVSDTPLPYFNDEGLQAVTEYCYTVEAYDTADNASQVNEVYCVTTKATPPAPVAPTVNAGDDKSVNENSAVQLNASASDSDGSIASYAWTQTSGINVELQNSDKANPTFNAPDIGNETQLTLVFSVTVTDDSGLTANDSVSIIIKPMSVAENVEPEVNAGEDINVKANTRITLTGSASDSDGLITSTVWQQTSGRSVTLENAETLNPVFTAPVLSGDDTLQFTLTVTDDAGAEVTDTVDVHVTDKGSLQVISASGMPAIGYSSDYIYYSVNEASLGRSGHVAYAGTADTNLRATSNASNAVWGGMPDNIKLLIKENDAIPGLATGVLFDKVSGNKAPIVNKSGDVAIYADLKGTGTQNNRALLVITDEGVKPVVQTYDPAPGFPTGAFISQIVAYQFTDAGMMIYGGINNLLTSAIWFWDYNELSLIAVADMANVYSLAESSTDIYPDCRFSSFNFLANEGAMNNDGEIIFTAKFSGSACPTQSLIRWSDGSLHKIMDTDDSVPGITDGEFRSITLWDINDQGDVTVGLDIYQPDQLVATSAWQINKGESPKLLALNKELIPNDYIYQMQLIFSNFLINNNGTAVSIVRDTNNLQHTFLTGSAREAQPYASTTDAAASQLNVLAQTSTVPPGYSDTNIFAGFGFSSDLSINNAGQRVFNASILDVPNSVQFQSLWFADQNGALQELAFAGATVVANDTEQTLQSAQIHSNSIHKGHSAQFDDAGHVVFYSQLSGAFQANILATPSLSE